MKRWILAGMATALCLAPALAAENPTREEILGALAVADSQLPNLDAPQPHVAPPHEKDVYVNALAKLASDKPDPVLILTLLRYQLAYLDPENDVASRAMGVVFLEQPDAFTTVYQQLPAAGRVILGAYLKFGFEKAVEGRNLSSPKVVAAKKKFDALYGSLINARSRDDQPAPAPGQ